MVELNGRCLCGAVTWHYNGPRGRNLVCHCESCQRATSAPFAAFVGLDPNNLTWSGKINHYESSPKTWRGFCPACGSRLYFKSAKWPGEIHLHSSTLDDRAAYQPDQEVVCEERIGWLDHLPDIPKHNSFGASPEPED
ncbi:GFA family protein [Phaeobacter sp. NW0010-22]|uniref:GFA family protein n=1 Tax=Phaeobacter sp. NW0010-22 TaxID=3135907 RepID=UPI00333F3712